MSKRKLKSAKIEEKQTQSRPFDLRATDLPINAHVSIVDIDDPFEAGAKITAVRSLRDDPLAAMRASCQIDEVQFLAGRHWQFCYIRSELGAIRGIDPTKQRVDGGQLADPISEVQKKAIKDLNMADRSLGVEGTVLIRDILGRGLTISQAADSRGLITERGHNYIGKRFRECLDTLAIVFCYAGSSLRVNGVLS